MINQLCDSFTAEIRKTAINNQIKIICTEQKFLNIILHYIKNEFNSQNLKSEENIRTRCMKILTQIKESRADNLTIIIFWLKDDDLTLNANQYHRITLIRMNKKTKIIKNADKKAENSLSEINYKINYIYFLIWVKSLI